MTNEQMRKLFMIVIIFSLLLSMLTITFSFFYSRDKGKKNVQVESAKLELKLEVKKLTSENTTGLIPLNDNELQNAIEGSTNGTCIDSIGAPRCQVYQVDLTNTSNARASLTGSLKIEPDGNGSKFSNIKWLEIRGPKDATAIGQIHTMKDTNWKNIFIMDPNGTATFYLIIWISDTGKDQTLEDTGSFIGNITFNSSVGAEANAAFTG